MCRCAAMCTLVATPRAGHGTIHIVPVVMLLAALAILAGVVIVASGRGGEMAHEYPDYPPLDLGPVTAADVALLRPPSAAWGYNMRVTDEALERIAQALTERDVQISALQQQVADLRDEMSHSPAPQPGARHAAQRPVLSPEPARETPPAASPPDAESMPEAADQQAEQEVPDHQAAARDMAARQAADPAQQAPRQDDQDQEAAGQQHAGPPQRTALRFSGHAGSGRNGSPPQEDEAGE